MSLAFILGGLGSEKEGWELFVRELDAPCELRTLRAHFGRAVRALDALRSVGDALCGRWTRCAVSGTRCAGVGRAAQCGGRVVRALDALRSERLRPLRGG